MGTGDEEHPSGRLAIKEGAEFYRCPKVRFATQPEIDEFRRRRQKSSCDCRIAEGRVANIAIAGVMKQSEMGAEQIRVVNLRAQQPFGGRKKDREKPERQN